MSGVTRIIVTAMPDNTEYEMIDKKEIKSFLDEIDDMKLEKTSFDAGSLNGASKAYEIVYENGDSTRYIISSGYLGKQEEDKIQWYQMKQLHTISILKLQVQQIYQFFCKRITTKLEETLLTSIALSVFVTNLFKLQKRILFAFLYLFRFWNRYKHWNLQISA